MNNQLDKKQGGGKGSKQTLHRKRNGCRERYSVSLILEKQSYNEILLILSTMTPTIKQNKTENPPLFPVILLLDKNPELNGT